MRPPHFSPPETVSWRGEYLVLGHHLAKGAEPKSEFRSGPGALHHMDPKLLLFFIFLPFFLLSLWNPIPFIL